MSLKTALKPFVPKRVREARYVIAERVRRIHMGMLSNTDLFSKIYAEGLWGKGPGFDSGPGSDARFVPAYCQALEELVIRPRSVRTLADIGCGDFRVGSHVAPLVGNYIGIDVVPRLIEHNRRQYGSGRVSFVCADITRQAPPAADVCTIRQVFQHLTNKEIQTILANCRAIPAVVVTEALYVGPDCRPNQDIPHGPETRVEYRSGVFLDLPPYSLKLKTLVELPYYDRPHEVLRTSLIENVR